jgi:hypothetical protein
MKNGRISNVSEGHTASNFRVYSKDRDIIFLQNVGTLLPGSGRNPDDYNVNIRCRDNFKSYKLMLTE